MFNLCQKLGEEKARFLRLFETKQILLDRLKNVVLVSNLISYNGRKCRLIHGVSANVSERFYNCCIRRLLTISDISNGADEVDNDGKNTTAGQASITEPCILGTCRS